MSNEQRVPNLLPLKRRTGEVSVGNPTLKPEGKNNDQLNSIIKDTIQKSPVAADQKKNQKNAQQSNREPLLKQQEKTKEKKQKKSQYKQENQRTKENQKMKQLIAQMMSSMSAKNLTQQLYPVSNEVIEEFIGGIQDEINQLKSQADKKMANQNSSIVEKEVEVIKRQINHCVLIKELYMEKIGFRNKVKSLQEQIISLRAENRDLKLKVSRGIQSIQNYKHNLPCQREKQLIQKLSITTQDLNKQREMRQNLEKNIQSLVLNFKKLFEQADNARKIVTNKLKELQEKQRNVKKNSHTGQESSDNVWNRENKRGNSSGDNVFGFLFGQKDNSRFGNSFYQDSNDASQLNKRQFDESSTNKKSIVRPQPLLIPTNIREENQKSRDSRGTNNDKGKQKQKEKNKKSTVQTAPPALTLQQKINKMRNNQINFMKTVGS